MCNFAVAKKGNEEEDNRLQNKRLGGGIRLQMGRASRNQEEEEGEEMDGLEKQLLGQSHIYSLILKYIYL